MNQYTLTFDTNGGSAIGPSRYGTAITAPADPTWQYVCSGNPHHHARRNMTIKANWTVNHLTNGGNHRAYHPETAPPSPPPPIPPGYTFGVDPGHPGHHAAENLTVTAQWRCNGGGSSG